MLLEAADPRQPGRYGRAVCWKRPTRGNLGGMAVVLLEAADPRQPQPGRYGMARHDIAVVGVFGLSGSVVFPEAADPRQPGIRVIGLLSGPRGTLQHPQLHNTGELRSQNSTL